MYGGYTDSRFGQILVDEPLRKYLYEHSITPDNYLSHQKELLQLFPDEKSYQDFIHAYLTDSGLLSYRRFLNPPQKIDVFLHPRYIQQSPHIHDFYELKFLLKGSGTVHIASELVFLKEADLCLIPPYVPHSSEVYTDDAIMVNIVLPAEYLPALLPRVMGYDNVFRRYFSQELSLFQTRHLLSLRTKDDLEISRLIQSMLDYYGSTKSRSVPGYLATEGSLEQVFLRILAMNPEVDPSEPEQGEEKLLNTFTAYMRAHLQNVSLADISGLLHFSEPYTSRYIKKKTGYPFQMLLLIFRMEETARLLKQTDWPVDQIAAEVGLTGKTNFYRQFKSFYGMSPAEFRKNDRR